MRLRCLTVFTVYIVTQVNPVSASPYASNPDENPLKKECLQLRSEGNPVLERNCWYKYIALEQMNSGDVPDKELPEIEKRYLELDKELKAAKPTPQDDQLEGKSKDESLISSGVDDQIEPGSKKPKRKKSGQRSFSVTQRRSKAENEKMAVEMMKKAQEAEDHGRLEEALKLYRIAGKLDPANASVRTEASRLEKEIQ